MARDLAARAAQAVEQQRNGSGETLQQQLVKMEAQFQRAMPKGMEAVQLIRDVMTCMSQTPKLALCEPKSVLGAAMTCSQLGLRPGVGALGHAWILPFWDSKYEIPGQRGKGANRAQLIIGYKGFIELGHRSDRIASLHSRIVYANDLFDIEYGAAEDKWLHKPCLDGPRGAPRLFYAVGRLANGGYSVTDPMTVADMEEHRDRFAMARKDGKVVGPWADHFNSMGRKTMLLRLMALMPKSTEMQRAIDNDNSVRVDLATEAIDTPMHIDGEVIDAEPPREVIEVSAPPEPPTIVALISPEQSRRLHALLGAEGLGGKTAEERQARIDWLSTAVGRTITTSKELTSVEAGETIQMLEAAQAQP